MHVERDDGQMNHQGPGARVVFRLSPHPDEYWAALFHGDGGRTKPEGYSHPMSMAHPDLTGELVAIDVPTGKVAEYVKKLDERIDATNAQYKRDVIPLLERARDAQARSGEESRCNREADQQALDELNKRRSRVDRCRQLPVGPTSSWA